MKKLIFGIAALFMMSVVLVGCDGKKSKKDKDDEEEDERTEKMAKKDKEDDEDMASFSATPEDKFFDILEDALRVMKRTHLRTQDDVTALAEKMTPLKSKMEQALKDLMEAYKDKTPDELKELEEKFEERAKDISEKLSAEGDRLEKEAEEAGLDMSELNNLDIL